MDEEKVSKRSISPDLYLTILESIKNYGKLPDLGIPKTHRNFYVSRLKKQGLIKRISYGVWELTQTSISPNLMSWTPPKTLTTSISPKKAIRGHGFIWRLVFPKEILPGSSLVQFLIKGGIVYMEIRPGVFSFKWKGYDTWFSRKSLVFYCPKDKSFYGSSASECRELAGFEVKYLIKRLESALKLNFRSNGQYTLKLCRQHYGAVNNELAMKRVREHEPLRVSDDSGEWLLVDLSQGLVELETVHPKTARDDMDEVIEPYFDDIKNKRPPLPSEMWKVLVAEVQNWKMYGENMVSHVHAVQDLAKGVNDLRDAVKDFRKASNEPSSRLSSLMARIKCPGDVLSLEPEIKALSLEEKASLSDWLFSSDFGRGR